MSRPLLPIQLAVTFALSLGCAHPATPPLVHEDPTRFLRVGLDPRSEADELERRLEASGYARVARVASADVVALSMRREDGATLVRVVTRRGLVLSVDAPTESLERSAVGVEDVPLDLDGDGHPEIVLSATDAARDRRCLALVRVAPDGSLREVTPTLELGGDACVEALRDLGDGRAAALAVVRFVHLAIDRPPSLSVPFGPGSRGAGGATWEIRRDGAARTFLAEQRRERVVALATARDARDARAAYRIGVELAALAWLAGEADATQRQALSVALEGLDVPPPISRAREQAEAWIAAGWQDEHEGEDEDAPDADDEREQRGAGDPSPTHAR